LASVPGSASNSRETFTSPADFVQSYNARTSALKEMKAGFPSRPATDNDAAALTALNASMEYLNGVMETLRQRGNELFGDQFSYDQEGMGSLMTNATIPLN
jgi:hypothetical protein